MLRAINKISTNLGSLRSFCTASPVINKPLGQNRVTVSGKVVWDSKALDNGVKSFVLRSQDSVHGTTMARVHTNRDHIKAGQYLYVNGVLNVTEFVDENGKSRNDATVKAQEISFINAAHQDRNVVEMRTVVASDVIKTTDFSMFRVLYKFVPKGKTEAIAQFHSVRVYDEELRELVANTFKKSLQIRLIGRLETFKALDKEKRNRSSAFIRATNIMTIRTPKEVQAELDDSSSSSSSSDEEETTVEQKKSAE